MDQPNEAKDLSHCTASNGAVIFGIFARPTGLVHEVGWIRHLGGVEKTARSARHRLQSQMHTHPSSGAPPLEAQPRKKQKSTATHQAAAAALQLVVYFGCCRWFISTHKRGREQPSSRRDPLRSPSKPVKPAENGAGMQCNLFSRLKARVSSNLRHILAVDHWLASRLVSDHWFFAGRSPRNNLPEIGLGRVRPIALHKSFDRMH